MAFVHCSMESMTNERSCCTLWRRNPKLLLHPPKPNQPMEESSQRL
ncbi:hypothetical protein CCACVL1_30527 [Corchorus capsularis]|uniref:Uncharacterized protein n=1 Tax=Corchorus capsularis TaxID=210143 RepID=A0A1R3FWQ8_COCAP|nr:hypothetical protein CCACVL1_30527 [Corchorus capsularis]